MAIAILQSTIAIPRPTNPSLSSVRFLSGSDGFGFRPISINHSGAGGRLVIRNGGGPRTFPGGVSKWQWKRMQTMKAKQLLKARLLRERQIYEMRKRAELKVAVSELERPWELVRREMAAPKLFSVAADEQVKVLADRFQKPGGFDMWTERDGPQVFQSPEGLPSARFFPKGVVHSVKPYGIVGHGDDDDDDDGEDLRFDDWIARGGGGIRRRRRRERRISDGGVGVGSDGESTQGVWDNALSSDESNITRITSDESPSHSFEPSGRSKNSGNGRRRGSNDSHEAKQMDVANYGERRQGVFDNALSSDGPKITRARARDDRKVFQEQGNHSFAANGRSRNSGNGRRRGSNDSREAKPMAAANYGERRQSVFDNALSSDGSKITRGGARDDRKVFQEQGNRSFAANGRSRNSGNGRRRGSNDSREAKPMAAANYGERRQSVFDNALSSDGSKITRGHARDDLKVFQEQGNRSFAANGRSRNSGNGRRRGSNDSMAAANYGERRQGVFDNALSSDGSKITRGHARDDRKVSQEQGSQSFAANGRPRNGGNGRRRGFNGSFKSEDAANYRGEEVSEIERRGRSRNGGNRRFNDERVSLRPTSDLYSEDDDFQIRE